MLNLGKKIADQIDYSNSTLRYPMWLDQEVNDLASSIAGLDAFPSQAILPLVKIAANGEVNCRRLALMLDMEEATVDDYLQSLFEFKFIKETVNGYTATPLGEQTFKAIGMRMVNRELYELKRRLDQLKKLDEQLKDF